MEVEKKRIAVDYLEKYILMNHLNRNALKYIPGMRNKEKKPATICLAYFHNKIMYLEALQLCYLGYKPSLKHKVYSKLLIEKI